MLKYVDTQVVFREVPNEITLAINISNCPFKCEECHSPYLREDIGKPLDIEAIDTLIRLNEGITCICFMGGDKFINELNQLAKHIKETYPNLLVALYSGQDDMPHQLQIEYFDFVKIGHYDKEKGPLNSKTTNQILWKITKKDNKINWENITSMFWN